MATRRKKKTTPARRRRRAPAAKAPVRRRRRRKNPDLVTKLSGGVRDAGLLLAGEAATRAIPGALNLPAGGTTGMLAQVATAVGVGMVADRALKPTRGAMVLAGALAVPIRDAIVRANVPVASAALTPSPLGAGSYAGRLPAGRARRVGGMGSYARRVPASAPSLASGSYVHAAAPGYQP